MTPTTYSARLWHSFCRSWAGNRRSDVNPVSALSEHMRRDIGLLPDHQDVRILHGTTHYLG